MAAELDFGSDALASMFSVRQSPWHREGVLLAEAPGFTEALELARLDYEVNKVPTYWRSSSQRGQFVESSHAFLTVRTDRGTELGSVGPEYTPLQNRDAFQPIRPLVDAGVLQLETGGVLREGADAWLLGRFNVERFGPVIREVFADEVVPYILVANNHNGRRKARIAQTPIRVVCANTLDMVDQDIGRGINRAVAVRHVQGAGRRMVEAAEELLGAIIERYELLARQYRVLKSVTLTPTEFDALVLDPVAPDPRTKRGWTPSTPSGEAALERALGKRYEIRRLWTEGDGHAGDFSAWEAFNAFVQAVDHGTGLFPVKFERTRSLLDGRLRDLKRTCKNRLLDHAKTNRPTAAAIGR